MITFSGCEPQKARNNHHKVKGNNKHKSYEDFPIMSTEESTNNSVSKNEGMEKMKMKNDKVFIQYSIVWIYSNN